MSSLRAEVSSAPLLFEHFMVIGPTIESGVERARALRGELHLSTSRARLSRRISNIGSMLRRSFAPLTPATSSTNITTPVGSNSGSGRSFSDAPPSNHNPSNSPLKSAMAASLPVEPSIIYRFPEDAEAPPPEVVDFCLPLGGKLDYIKAEDEELNAEEIFYGMGSNDHLSRCFIFILEDKNHHHHVEEIPCHRSNEEHGVDHNRLYGICVIHPRLLHVNSHLQGERETESDGTCEYSFETQVCYAFITRFPLFDFFFSAISSMITAEKLERMELKNNASSYDTNLFSNYTYIPKHLLEAVLHQIKNMQPPRYDSDLKIEFIRGMGIPPITIHRTRPSAGFPEYLQNALEWALPALLRWLPVDRLVWLLSLLLCEVKVIVVGSEAGTVSCAVMSILALLRPISWVAPLIPVLPLKYVEFVESPVPILAGVIIDDEDGAWTPENVLEKCE